MQYGTLNFLPSSTSDPQPSTGIQATLMSSSATQVNMHELGYITELMSIVFENLGGADLKACEAASPLWEEMIQDDPNLKPSVVLKIAPVEDPHFKARPEIDKCIVQVAAKFRRPVAPSQFHFDPPWLEVPQGTPYLQAAQMVVEKFLGLFPFHFVSGPNNAVVAGNAIGQTPRYDEHVWAIELDSALQDVLKLSCVPSNGTKFPRPARTRHVIPSPTNIDTYESEDGYSDLLTLITYSRQSMDVSTMESCQHCTLKIDEIQRQLSEDREDADSTSAVNDWSIVTRLKEMVCGKCQGWIEEPYSSSRRDFPRPDWTLRGDRDTLPRRELLTMMHKMYCKNCTLPHSEFLYDNIHPRLQFLKGLPFCCVQGSGSKLFIQFNVFPHLGPHSSSSDAANKLKSVLKAVADLDLNVRAIQKFVLENDAQRDQMARPFVTDCIMFWHNDDSVYRYPAKSSRPQCFAELHNVNGITLEEFVRPLTKMAWQTLKEYPQNKVVKEWEVARRPT
jgi:hypothetical protein